MAVALPEEMPVNETIELEDKIRDELGMDLARVFVNGVLPERFSTAEAEAMASVDGAGSAGGARGAGGGAGGPRAHAGAALAGAPAQARRGRAGRNAARSCSRRSSGPRTSRRSRAEVERKL